MLGNSSIPNACANGRLPSYQIAPRVTRAVCKGRHTVVGRHNTAINSTNAMDSAAAEDVMCMRICTMKLIHTVVL